MAHVSGPTSGLPGRIIPVDSLQEDITCDDHPDRQAVARVQGETDSFGAEYIDMCRECLEAFKAAPGICEEGTCDWCKAPSTDNKPTRDYDEGSCGRVYYVCGACRKKQREAAAAELEEDLRENPYSSGWL